MLNAPILGRFASSDNNLPSVAADEPQRSRSTIDESSRLQRLQNNFGGLLARSSSLFQINDGIRSDRGPLLVDDQS